jgi:hypothetical protein
VIGRSKAVDVGINMMTIPSMEKNDRLLSLKAHTLRSPPVKLTPLVPQTNAAIFLLSLLEGGHDPQPAAHLLAVLDFQFVVRAPFRLVGTQK